jgi:hypothetical protein
LGEAVLPKTRGVTPGDQKGKQMFEINDDLRSRRIVMLVFALLSLASAASTAVASALLRI